MTLIDTNVLLDILTRDANWVVWSLAQLDAASMAGPLLINDVIYAELCTRIDRMGDVDTFVDETNLTLVGMSRRALFLSAKAFGRYRLRGGTRTGVLPDFFIGAQAAALGCKLVTRDVARYRTYFPEVELISPKLS